MSVLSVRGAIVANLVSSGAVKEFVRIIRVAKLTLIQCVCFITAGPITKLCAWGEEESGGHVL